MAKRTKGPQSGNPSPSARKTPSTKVMREIGALMSELADTIIEDYFFDPEREDLYFRLQRTRNGAPPKATLHQFDVGDEDGDYAVVLTAGRARGSFTVTVAAPSFQVEIQGLWSFDDGALTEGTVRIMSGDPAAIVAGLDRIADLVVDHAIDESELADMIDEDDGPAPAAAGNGHWHPALTDDDDPDFASSDDDDLSPASSYDDDLTPASSYDDDLTPASSYDDDDTPPPPTAADRRQLLEIAGRLARQDTLIPGPQDRAWLGNTPQILPVILDCLVEAKTALGADPVDPKIQALVALFSLQLAAVRFEVEEDWPWAKALMDAVQQRLAELAEQQRLPQDSWMTLATAMTEARVPIPEAMQTRLAAAGFSADPSELPEDLGDALREGLDALANSGASEFELIESFQGANGIVPPAMRCFMATEMARSPHAVLRGTLPMILMDPDPEVRRHVLTALGQPDIISGATLRRLIAIRNWLPAGDRPLLDGTVRAARMAGVEPAPWPTAPTQLEVHASFLDGSAAQTLLFIDRSGRTGTIAGVLLRHGVGSGTGVRESWLQEDASRSEINAMIDTFQSEMRTPPVNPAYADQVIQHAIASGLQSGCVPPHSLLKIAEWLGQHGWQDRQLDIAAAIEAEWNSLPDASRTPAGLKALHHDAHRLMETMPIFLTWAESGPALRRRYRKVERNAAIQQILRNELAERRGVWAERFLLVALCGKASHEPADHKIASAFTAVAKALADEEPLSDIPALLRIAGATARMLSDRRW